MIGCHTGRDFGDGDRQQKSDGKMVIAQTPSVVKQLNWSKDGRFFGDGIDI